MEKASPLHFARFEFKYILSKAKRKAVESDLKYREHYWQLSEARLNYLNAFWHQPIVGMTPTPNTLFQRPLILTLNTWLGNGYE